MARRIPEEWKLSPSQRLDIFNKEIAPREILPHVHHRNNNNNNNSIISNNDTNSRQQKPLAVIIVGQTGAGKTRLAPDLLQAMTKILSNNTTTTKNSASDSPMRQQQEQPSSTTSASISIAHLIADTYKTYHPHYATALSQQPDLASPLASTDARVWLSMACTLATKHTLPVLLESACRHPDDFIQLASIFHNAGYTVLVSILAVPYPSSLLGILARYYRDLPEAKSRGLPLRLTPRKVHDDSFRGLEEAARWVDGNEGHAVDGVVVVRRSGEVSYRNMRRKRTTRTTEGMGEEEKEEDGNEKVMENGRWESDPGALSALRSERERELSAEELEIARRDMEELRRLENPRVDEQVTEIEELITRLGKGKEEKEQEISGDSRVVPPSPEPHEVFDAFLFVREFVGQ